MSSLTSIFQKPQSCFDVNIGFYKNRCCLVFVNTSFSKINVIVPMLSSIFCVFSQIISIPFSRSLSSLLLSHSRIPFVPLPLKKIGNPWATLQLQIPVGGIFLSLWRRFWIGPRKCFLPRLVALFRTHNLLVALFLT